MLHSLSCFDKGKQFPPPREVERITRYRQNAALFDGNHFDTYKLRSMDSSFSEIVEVYNKCAQRISRIVGNFEEVISFPVLLNYQRLMSLKMADLVCGEYPSITGPDKEDNNSITKYRDNTSFDSKLYSTVIDISRYGDAVWRIYKDEESNDNNFTVWNPGEWYPIVSQDGTNTIKYHCLCWIENLEEDPDKIPIIRLHVQIHGTSKKDIGKYEHRIYKMDSFSGTIGKLVSKKTYNTGLDCCAVVNLKSFEVSNTIYGYDDYMTIDSILAEIMVRIGQISVILDKHADPSMTGPVSMLSTDPITGEKKLNAGKFYAINPGDTPPSYLTWDGQLSAAFKELEILINQLNIISEMGASLLGSTEGSGQAISGAAMRFKMVNPLAKARRICNSLTLPIRRLFSVFTDTDLANLSVQWRDGLPDDPREQIENAKLASGAKKLMPLEEAIMFYFDRSVEEATEWASKLKDDQDSEDPNKPGPQDGTGVNPLAKGSETGLNNFKSDSNKSDGS